MSRIWGSNLGDFFGGVGSVSIERLGKLEGGTMACCSGSGAMSNWTGLDGFNMFGPISETCGGLFNGKNASLLKVVLMGYVQGDVGGW